MNTMRLALPDKLGKCRDRLRNKLFVTYPDFPLDAKRFSDLDVAVCENQRESCLCHATDH